MTQSARRPRREETVTYQVRVELERTSPPVWRRLELASDLFLNDIHDVLQVTVGWTDSHLHRFASGPTHYGPETEHYVCPFVLEEDGEGIPEEQVRLDEVLADVGDALFYVYDFGDDWVHVVELEAVLPRDVAHARAVCTGGERPGPAEDSGSVPGYELFSVANDAEHPHHCEAMAELRSMYGDDVDPASHRPVLFDIDDVNGLVGDLGIDDAKAITDLPAPLADLHGSLLITTGKRELRRLFGRARLDDPVLVDADVAARMVRPYAWLLDRVGDDGIKLTSAGYLPPAHVEAAMEELDMKDEWIGTHNCEVQTLPVLHLRESAQAMGLLRKYRGKLLLTKRADALRADPVALWWHLAGHMPPRSRDDGAIDGGLLYLVTVAAGVKDDREGMVQRLMSALGWMSGDRTPLTRYAVSDATFNTRKVLRRLGCFEAYGLLERKDPEPTPEGITFARAALLTWPAKTTA